ncbi:phytanoyl-CoA dioxygenase family protein [Frankia gtarii]|uniref:phytanoyl-CoA dioxygenase family protein n=1 Tax=Frankia gtarii TaxID=2950102 RepID=UPI0021BFF856|nr:phytanoyl-CoA dioxygenase family protein [Frankia gtarii]
MNTGQAADYRARLRTAGIFSVADLYPPQTVARWNETLDREFAEKADQARSYVGADRLVALGIVEKLFSERLRQVIRALIPDAVLYHCHVYETAANQERSHIHAGRLNGWHRDTETIRLFDPTVAPQYISIFVYLTDVASGSGGFELRTLPPAHAIAAGNRSVVVQGRAGTAFVWNRSFYHRATPNLSPVRRRVLKLSIQSTSLPNDRIELPEFAHARTAVNPADEYLGFLFGVGRSGPGAARQLPQPADPATTLSPAADLVPNSVVEVTRADALWHRVSAVKYRLPVG